MAKERKDKGKPHAGQKGKTSPREREQIQYVTVNCPTCGGSGKRGMRTCTLCNGSGTIEAIE